MFASALVPNSWKAKDTTEIAINSIYTEHCEKERKYTKPKTIYTCNPFPSIEMNNGLGMRVPFVTDKVGYEAGQTAVEVGDDPDVKRVVDQLLGASKLPTEKYAEVSDRPLLRKDGKGVWKAIVDFARSRCPRSHHPRLIHAHAARAHAARARTARARTARARTPTLTLHTLTQPAHRARSRSHRVRRSAGSPNRLCRGTRASSTASSRQSAPNSQRSTPRRWPASTCSTGRAGSTCASREWPGRALSTRGAPSEGILMRKADL